MKNHALIFPCVYPDKIQRSLGGHRIASFLREYNWDVEVIDYVLHFTIDELKEIVRSRVTSCTKFFGFSFIFNEYDHNFLQEFLPWLKKMYSDILIIFGGQNIVVNPYPADYYVNGFGENALMAILNYHFTNSNKELKLDDRWLLVGKKVITNNNYSSAPMKSLLVNYEDRDFIQPDEWVYTELSRGCKFKCEFCNFPLLGVKGDWTRDAEDFELYLKNMYDRFGVKKYYITDETFNDSTGKIEKFSNVVKRLDFDPIFSGFIRADLLVSRPLDRELLGEMGFISHFYGTETFNHLTGKIIGKGMHPDRLKEGLLDVRKYFKNNTVLYRGQLTLIVGLPQETEETIAQSVDWIFNNWQGEAIVFNSLELQEFNSLDANLSILSKNPEKYGYRRSNIPIPSVDTFESKKKYIQTKFSDKIFNWENDNFTYSRALDLVNKIYLKAHKLDFRLGAFNLHVSGVNDINETLKCDQKVYNWSAFDGKISRYKNSKINYK